MSDIKNKAEWTQINSNGNNYTDIMDLGSILLIRNACYCEENDMFLSSSIISAGRNDVEYKLYRKAKDDE